MFIIVNLYLFITVVVIGGRGGGGGGYSGSGSRIVVIGSTGVGGGGSIGGVAVAAAIDVGIIIVGVVCMITFCEDYCRCCVSFIVNCSISVAGGISVIILWNTT